MGSIVDHLVQIQVVHNDIKLENCILSPDGKLRLVDFGNARIGPPKKFAALLSRPKHVVGTPTYLAPEIVAGKAASFASDCYAIGICAHILLAGSALRWGTRS